MKKEDARARIDIRTRQVEIPIARQLHTFISMQIKRWRPDKIIVVERKGTAILRALKELLQLDWEWKKVISSQILNQVSAPLLSDERLLVFDDMTRTGYHLKVLLGDLRERGIWDIEKNNLRVAVFAAHEDSPNRYICEDDPRFNIDFHSFYRYLTTRSYQAIRSEILRMLQRSGSLLLDTEHIEVRVKLRTNLNSFVQALGRVAETVVFHSYDSRANITVYYGDGDAHYLPKHKFPEGSGLKKIVKKCRVVQRSDNEYALIPICYPSIPKGATGWPSDRDDLAMIGNSVKESDDASFYGAALLAALEVLKWPLKDLAIAGIENYSISLPASPKDLKTGSGYSLEHLLVMYPTLNIDKLNTRITEVWEDARKRGVGLKRKIFPYRASCQVSDEELHMNALTLLQRIRQDLDQRIIERGFWRGAEKRPPHPFGLRAKEIFRIGRECGWEEDERISALFDILIDEACLVTHVDEVKSENINVRTFEPDGEIVSDLVRRYTAQWGF